MKISDLYESILLEAPDYNALIEPIFRAIGDSLDEKTKNDITSDSNRRLKRTKQKLNKSGYQPWIMYVMTVNRDQTALDYAKTFSNNQAVLNNLQKIINKSPNKNDLDDLSIPNIVTELEHFASYDYDPIRTYQFGKKPWNDIKADLDALEQEMHDKIGDDSRKLSLQDGDEIIKKFNDGYVWIKLSRGICNAEAKAMGHCGNAASGTDDDVILSLRKERKNGNVVTYEPYLTFIYDKETKILGERKGRNNDKPTKKYHPYIVWLLSQPWIEGMNNFGHAPEMNFQLEDLDKDVRDALIKKNPGMKNIIGPRKLYDENGELHSDDGPAVITANGNQFWHQHGELHRDDGPAFIEVNGNQYWYQHDKLHRDDGPAVINADGYQEWYQHGLEHREDGPAVITANGSHFWYQNGKRHRVDGPAVIRTNGDQEWYQHGNLHRDDGPAAIFADGDQIWYQNGQFHRDDGPAVIYAEGNQYWYRHGKDITNTMKEWAKQNNINTKNLSDSDKVKIKKYMKSLVN